MKGKRAKSREALKVCQPIEDISFYRTHTTTIVFLFSCTYLYTETLCKLNCNTVNAKYNIFNYCVHVALYFNMLFSFNNCHVF